MIQVSSQIEFGGSCECKVWLQLRTLNLCTASCSDWTGPGYAIGRPKYKPFRGLQGCKMVPLLVALTWHQEVVT